MAKTLCAKHFAKLFAGGIFDQITTIQISLMGNSSNISIPNRWLFIVFSILWFVLIFFTYWGYHPYYSLSLGKGVNLDIALVSLLLCGGAGAWLLLPGKKKEGRSYNGLMLYAFVLLLQTVIIAIYGSKQNLFPNGMIAGIGYFIGFSILMHAAIFIILLLHFAIGYPIMKKLGPWYGKTSIRLLSIVLGISILGVIMVIIGQLNLLYGAVLWGLGLLAIGWQYKAVIALLKDVLWKPYKRKNVSWPWLLPSFVLMIAIAVNGIAAIKVFPLGFDGSALYMNISRLISDYHALPAGGQAYNWSVFMSLGQLLFGKMSLAIMLGHFSGILAILVLFRIGRLFMPAPAAWLAAALLYLSPAYNFHLTLDEKVDLGFLLITLGTLLLLIEYQVKLGSKKPPAPGQTIFSVGKISINESMAIWLLAGWLSGYAFGIKYTGIMSIFAFLTYLVYQKAGTKAGTGMLAALVSILFIGGIYRFGYIELGTASPLILGLVAAVVAAVLLFLAFRRQANTLRHLGFLILLFLIGSGIAFAPWMGKHLSETRQLSIHGLIQGKSSRPEVSVGLPTTKSARDPYQEAINLANKRGIRFSPEQQQQLRSIISEYDFKGASTEQQMVYAKALRNRVVKEVLTPQQIAQAGINQLTGFSSGVGTATELEGAKREEIKRYIGYEKGLPLYLSIPYDVTMNTNVRYLKYLDISFLFLLLIPLLLFSYRSKLALPKNLLLIAFAMLALIISVYSVYVNNGAAPDEAYIRNSAEQVLFKHHGTMQSVVGSVFMPVQENLGRIGISLHQLYTAMASFNFLLIFITLLLFTALFYWLFRERLSQLSKNFKGLMAYTFAFAFLWILLGSAIVWYALPMFALLFLLITYFIYQPAKAGDASLAPYLKYYLGVMGGIYLLFTTALNFMSTTEAEEQADMRFQKSFILYGISSMTEDEAIFDFNPFLAGTIDKINKDNKGKVYRVGTYFNYHIRYNDSRVYEDNQLELFGAFIDQRKDPRDFLQMLKDNGFKYILYDLYTPGLDNTPEQTLATKANRFQQLLRSSNQARLIYTDNIVQSPQNQRDKIGRLTLPGRLGLDGNTVQQGTFALFELQ
jgi:hypothetical protein